MLLFAFCDTLQGLGVKEKSIYTMSRSSERGMMTDDFGECGPPTGTGILL
jgi:hypothetical protein